MLLYLGGEGELVIFFGNVFVIFFDNVFNGDLFDNGWCDGEIFEYGGF